MSRPDAASPRRHPLLRFSPYLKRYRGPMLMGVACILLYSALRVEIPRYLGEAVDLIRARRITAAQLAWFSAFLFALAGLAGCFLFLMRRMIIDASREIEFDFRNDFFRRLEALDPAFYDGQQTGDLMSRATSDIEALRMALGPGILQLMNTVFSLPLALWKMFSISPRLSLWALSPLLLLPPFVSRLMMALHERSRETQDQTARLTTVAQENLAGIRVVKAYVQEDSEIAKFERENERLIDCSMAFARLQAFFFPSLRLVGALGLILVLLIGGRQVIQGAIQIGDLVAITILYQMLVWPLIALGWVVSLWQRGSAASERLWEVFDAQPLVAPAEPLEFPAPRVDPSTLPEEGEPEGNNAGGANGEAENGGVGAPAEAAGDDGASARPALRMRGAISIRGLTFTYPGAARPALRGLSVELPAGGSLGVVGAVGSGKSTLLAALCRLYPVERGRVFVDGRDINDWPLNDLRRQISLVFQEPFIFSESVADNLAFGRGAETIGETAILDAVQSAHFHEDVERMPGQFETPLGERGINLSGGQKQRLTLARGLLRDPRILLIDDALSAVDTHTESRILAHLRQAARERTTIVVAHRLSTLSWCGHIIVLDDGRLAEEGDHESLLARGGLYAEIFRKQQLEEEVEALAPEASERAASGEEAAPR